MTRTQKEPRVSDALTSDGMEAFGKPVPNYRKDAALQHCRGMGLTDTNAATGMINRMAYAIERDEPYKAMEAGTAHLDLTGTYRLMAVLCVDDKPAQEMVYDEWGF